MLRLTLLFLLLSLNNVAISQTCDWGWSKHYHPTTFDAPGNKLVKPRRVLVDDTNGFVYLFGTYDGDLTIVNDTSIIDTDLNAFHFISKYTTEGEFLWVKEDGMSAQANDMFIDESGNLHLVGPISSPINFPDTILGGGGDGHYYARLDSDWDLQHIKRINSIQNGGTRNRVTADADGNYFILLYSAYQIQFDNGYVYTDDANEYPRHIIKFNAEGEFQWIRNLHSDFSNQPEHDVDIACDSEGNLIVGGTLINDLSVKDENTILFEETANQEEIYCLKFNPDGDLLWGHVYENAGVNYFYDLAIDKEDRIYLMGTFHGLDTDVDFGNLSTFVHYWAPFFARLSPEGETELIVTEEVHGDAFFDTDGISIDVDDNYNTVITGRYRSQGTVAVGGVMLPSLSVAEDSFISIYDSNGIFQCVESIYGSYDDIITDAAISNNQEVFVTGYFTTETTIGETTLVSSAAGSLYDEVAKNAFLSRLDFDLTPVNVEVISDNINIEIYPNPNQGFFEVDLSSIVQYNEGYEVSLFDLNGKVLFEDNIDTPKVKLEIPNLLNGFYILNIKTKHQVFLDKIIIVN